MTWSYERDERVSWRRMKSPASRIAVLYALCGSLWIFFSDRALEWLLITQPGDLGIQQTLKGLGFIGVTALSLYFIIDRSNQKLRSLETALDQSKASLELMVGEASDYALMLLDAEGRIRSWNRGAERIKGYRAEEVIGQPIDILYNEEARAAGLPAALLERARRDGRAEEESWHQRRNGERFLANVVVNAVHDKRGKLLGFARLTRDVTERRRAQRDLEQMQERLRLLLQSVELGLSDSLLSERRIKFSGGWLRHFGYEEGDRSLTVKEWEALVHPDDRPVIRAQIDRMLSGHGGMSDGVYRFRCRDGSHRWILAKARALLDEDGKPVRLLASHLDITERRATEERLRRAQRLEAVGKLTGGVAHDFNNLLTVVLGNAELLAERLGHDAEGAQLAQVVYAAAERGASLARRLLAFAGNNPAGLRETAPARLVDALMPLLQRTLGGGIDLAVESPEEPWTVFVDPQLLENVLINLASNARDAMPEGGTVTLRLANCRSAAGSALSGPVVEIVVADEGSGMTPEVAARAFDPFFSTKPAHKGSGLGLSLVQDFARQSGGEVVIERNAAGGSSIILRLPTRSAPQLAGPEHQPGTAPRGTGERVLVVEDDDAVRRLIVELLESLGYRILSAANGEEGLALLQGERPDLLVTDVTMPGQMSGVDLMQAARASNAALPLLLISGDLSEIADLSRLPGPEILSLQKPFTRRQFATAIRSALAKVA